MQFTEISTEQTTAATDLILFFALLIMSVLLYRRGRPKDQLKTNIWVSVFILVALAALLGSIAHGIKMSEKLHFIIWQPLNLFLGISVGLFGAGVIYDWKRDHFNKKILIILILTGILFYLASILLPGGFLIFIIYEALFMLFALSIYLQLFIKRKIYGAGMLTMGIIITIVAAVIQSIPSIQFHVIWTFDHNGIFHLIQFLGFISIFFGLTKSFQPSQ